MSIREELIRAINELSEEELQAVWDYVNFLRESEEVEPTNEELEALARGRAEFERGEYVEWRHLKQSEGA